MSVYAGPVTCISVLRSDTELQQHDTQQACTESQRLLTGHHSGQVKLWAVHQGRPLQPLAILGAPTTSPVQSLVVLDDLQLLCFGHVDGHLALHHTPQIVAAAPVAQPLNGQDMTVISVQSSCCQTHDSGLMQCISCELGLISVGRAGSILLWSRAQLTKMAQQSCSHPSDRYCCQLQTLAEVHKCWNSTCLSFVRRLYPSTATLYSRHFYVGKADVSGLAPAAIHYIPSLLELVKLSFPC